ncbi:MAG: hypothetical protein ACREBU_25440, partial [Nitrososphaera sp.]
METSSFSQILESQFKNFETSKQKYEDILTWAERVKEYVSPHNVLLEAPDPIEYGHLIHICGNAFIVSILTTMKGHIFISEAIARVGVEAIKEMAIIEVDITNHLPIWRRFNLENPHSNEWQQIFGEYRRIFRNRENIRNYDYSAFIRHHERTEIINRWGQLSHSGSHVNFVQTTMNTRFDNTDDTTFMHTGLFDIENTGEHDIGTSMVYLIDTYFILALISSRILTRHNTRLKRTTVELENSYLEWFEFKIKKAREFGIRP